ncbi:hypothetical protein KY290_017873 [Solanum tuberosum]|uniref:Uncharacterized protein n=1 Tax=Solanum tuberosum TaxID=4113 RepID=A0ABQ7VFG1_SOLTU|nr:hypothetical protein KY290_017873 [Solanum tuberosum]
MVFGTISHKEGGNISEPIISKERNKEIPPVESPSNFQMKERTQDTGFFDLTPLNFDLNQASQMDNTKEELNITSQLNNGKEVSQVNNSIDNPVDGAHDQTRKQCPNKYLVSTEVHNNTRQSAQARKSASKKEKNQEELNSQNNHSHAIQHIVHHRLDGNFTLSVPECEC